MEIELGDTLRGRCGEATELRAGAAEGPGQGLVAIWWLDCPGQSPAWRHYLLSVCHLRPIDGKAAEIVVPNATHEVMLAALDPATNPQPTTHSTWVVMSPLNLAEQVQLPNDEDGVDLACGLARAVVDGVLWAEPPLSVQVEPWRTTLIKSSAHLRGEAHAP